MAIYKSLKSTVTNIAVIIIAKKFVTKMCLFRSVCCLLTCILPVKATVNNTSSVLDSLFLKLITFLLVIISSKVLLVSRLILVALLFYLNNK